MNWLAAIWSQLFRAERMIGPERFLRANVMLGLFAIVILVAEARHPERSSLLLTVLVLSTVALGSRSACSRRSHGARHLSFGSPTRDSATGAQTRG
jgi:hypothetical protein